MHAVFVALSLKIYEDIMLNRHLNTVSKFEFQEGEGPRTGRDCETKYHCPVCGHADRLPDLVAAAGVPRVPLHHPLPPAHGQRHPETSGQWPRPQQGECIYQHYIIILLYIA